MNIKKNIHISTYIKKYTYIHLKGQGVFFGSDNVKKKKIRFDINKVYILYLLCNKL